LSRTIDIAMAKRSKSAVGKGTPRGKRTDHSTALLTTISTNLKRHRTRQGHSLERLARLAGVSRAMLSQIETGKSVPTISLLLKVADALGVPIANLLADAGSRVTACCKAAADRQRQQQALHPRAPCSPRSAAPRRVLRGAHRQPASEADRGGRARRERRRAKARIELRVGNEQPVVVPQATPSVTPTARTASQSDQEAVVHVDAGLRRAWNSHPYAFAGAEGRKWFRWSRRVPGFGLSLGFTLAYLSLIVFIPLARCSSRAALGFKCHSGAR
jgi:transcriptional regulator with XRE-family HTH domain